jgi:hypothetical protein
MEKGRVARVVIVALTLPAWVGVLRASEIVEAGPGAKVRVTTAQAPGVVAGQPPTAQGGVPSTGPGRSLPTVGLAILGTIVELDRDAITVVRRFEKDRIRIQRTTITRLEVKKGRTRGRNALIGAGIGAALGLGLAVIEHSRCRGEWLCGVEFALPILTTPAGALVGLAIPGNQRWVEASPAGIAVLPSRTGVRVAWSVRF